jgi:hypothetical protein
MEYNRYMAITYSIDKAARIVCLVYTGAPDFSEWAQTMLSVFRDPNFERGYSFIMDRSHATEAPSKDYIDQTAAFHKEHKDILGKTYVAIVVSGPASFGMARMAQVLMEDNDYAQAFTDIEDAKQWLHIVGNKQ